MVFNGPRPQFKGAVISSAAVGAMPFWGAFRKGGPQTGKHAQYPGETRTQRSVFHSSYAGRVFPFLGGSGFLFTPSRAQNGTLVRVALLRPKKRSGLRFAQRLRLRSAPAGAQRKHAPTSAARGCGQLLVASEADQKR